MFKKHISNYCIYNLVIRPSIYQIGLLFSQVRIVTNSLFLHEEAMVFSVKIYVSIQIMNVYECNGTTNEVKYGSSIQRGGWMELPYFTEWKYLFHCTNEKTFIICFIQRLSKFVPSITSAISSYCLRCPPFWFVVCKECSLVPDLYRVYLDTSWHVVIHGGRTVLRGERA